MNIKDGARASTHVSLYLTVYYLKKMLYIPQNQHCTQQAATFMLKFSGK